MFTANSNRALPLHSEYDIDLVAIIMIKNSLNTILLTAILVSNGFIIFFDSSLQGPPHLITSISTSANHVEEKPIPQAQKPLLMDTSSYAQELKELRFLVEEIARNQAHTQHVENKSNAQEYPQQQQEAIEVYSRIQTQIHRSIDKGSWDEDDRRTLRSEWKKMDKSQRSDLLDQIAQAVKNQDIELNAPLL